MKINEIPLESLIPGKWYASLGHHGSYIYSSVRPGFMVPVEVYTPTTPFFFLRAIDWQDGSAKTSFAHILYKEKVGFLKVKLVHGPTATPAAFSDEGPTAESYRNERLFFAWDEKLENDLGEETNG